MVMELMEGGDLFSYIVQKDKLPEQEASVAVWRVASALSYERFIQSYSVYQHAERVATHNSQRKDILRPET